MHCPNRATRIHSLQLLVYARLLTDARRASWEVQVIDLATGGDLFPICWLFYFEHSLAKTRPIVTLLAGIDKMAYRIENERDGSECEMISNKWSVKVLERSRVLRIIATWHFVDRRYIPSQPLAYARVFTGPLGDEIIQIYSFIPY